MFTLLYWLVTIQLVKLEGEFAEVLSIKTDATLHKPQYSIETGLVER